ncbi:hypothetical protein CYMTET_4188 [Cymbomonas tetramitiformis]|uniref:Uncharacterized protein n=1 Tax=Cymbomonas tetramitiformis TaxID=36881 RepID=A0AAE0H1V7_9CHLO|nr:hypothetical protein CYMTET_4188 [Cymbomonas tetramitiformis]|eukprot:gene2803-3599_t
MNPYAQCYIPDAYVKILHLEAQNAVMREILRMPPQASYAQGMCSYMMQPTPCRSERRDASSQTENGGETCEVGLNTDRHVANQYTQTDASTIEALCAWRLAAERGRRVRERTDAGLALRRYRCNVAARAFAEWSVLAGQARYDQIRITRAYCRWRTCVLHEIDARTRSRASQLQLREDEHLMMTQQNADLQLAVDALKSELQEETMRLNNSRGTSAELMRRLKVSTDCIQSMRKDYALTCGSCKKTLMKMHETPRTEESNGLCSFVAEENFDDDERASKVISDFANLQLQQLMLS